MRKYAVVLAILLIASACGGNSGSEELDQVRAELDPLKEQIASTTTLSPDEDEPGWDDPYAACRGTSHCENAPAGYGSWDEYDEANDPNYVPPTTATPEYVPPTTATPERTTTDCPADDKSSAPMLTFYGPPPTCIQPSADYIAVFDTSEGRFGVHLDTEVTPNTVNNFIVLANYGYYDNTLLFRLDPTIAIIQGGAPHTEDWSDPGPGYTILDEGGVFRLDASGQARGPFTYEPGQLVMARTAGLNSSGAQFFFTTGDEASQLDAQGSYIVFGKTDKAGLAVLQEIMSLYEDDPTSPYGGGPTREVIVKSVTIVVD